jgi:hypothetical protein
MTKQLELMTDPTLRQMTFALGYQHGLQTGLHASAREVAERYPHMTTEMIDIYQNGRDDGVVRDDYRLNLGRAAMQGRAAT